MITFDIIPRSSNAPKTGINKVYLWSDNWNDYSFITMFDVIAFDENGVRHDLSNVKIGLIGQTEAVSTASTITSPFTQLPPNYFSVGQDAFYYATLSSALSEEFRKNYLTALRDVVFDPSALLAARDERVFNTSMLRSVSINAIENQFQRVLAGGTELTDYDFRFELDQLEKRAGFTLDFVVKANSLPPTNIHAIIGRNGVGKTSLLNSMIRAVTAKRKRWLTAIETLETDDNFAGMNLASLSELEDDNIDAASIKVLKKMSSGHAIVLLTITKLVARLEEKTLVLFDEPESHLHPPLLSALVRSLSELLVDRNAVAIIATHSPVVLQEIPRSCVWKIGRIGLSSFWAQPEIETFGENVGVLTREVFGLEVSKSGFNALLAEEAASANGYEDALGRFGGQLGFEGRAVLRSLMHHQSAG